MPLFMFISSTLVTAEKHQQLCFFDELYTICTVNSIAPNKQHPLEHSCYAQSIAQMKIGEVQSIAEREG